MKPGELISPAMLIDNDLHFSITVDFRISKLMCRKNTELIITRQLRGFLYETLCYIHVNYFPKTSNDYNKLISCIKLMIDAFSLRLIYWVYMILDLIIITLMPKWSLLLYMVQIRILKNGNKFTVKTAYLINKAKAKGSVHVCITKL